MVKVKKTVRHRRHFARLCKKRDIKRANRDTIEIAGTLYDQFVLQLLDRMEIMTGKHKTMTRKVAQLAFISVMNDAQLPDEEISSGLQYGHTAYETLYPKE